MLKRIGGDVAFLRRISAGLGANIFGKVLGLSAQVLLIPILSHQWGQSGFGIWLMLTTVPIYIGLSAAGFGAAAATDMTRLVAQDENHAAREVFQSVWLLITAVTALVALCAAACWAAAVTLRLEAYQEYKHVFDAAAILTAYAFFAIQTSIIQAAYRSTQRYAIGTVGLDLLVFAEGASVAITATLGANYSGAALGMLATRIIGTAFYYNWIRAKEPWFSIGYESARVATIRRLSKPALASLSLAASTALSLQGVILAIGTFISPAAAASYSTARTFCRMPLQISDLVSRASLPELTIAKATGNLKLFDSLTITSIVTAFLVLFPFYLALTIFGSEAIHVFSGRNIVFEKFLFPALSASILAQGLWLAGSQPLMATNRHHLVGFPYFISAVVMAMSPWLLRKLPMPVTSVAAVSAICELAILGVVIWHVYRDRGSFRVKA